MKSGYATAPVVHHTLSIRNATSSNTVMAHWGWLYRLGDFCDDNIHQPSNWYDEETIGQSVIITLRALVSAFWIMRHDQ
jgi:hypothetical protein